VFADSEACGRGGIADDVTAGDGTRDARLCRGRRSPGVDVSRRRTRRSKLASDRVLPEEWHSRGRRKLPLHVPASDSVPASSTRIPDEAGGRVSGESGVIHVVLGGRRWGAKCEGKTARQAQSRLSRQLAGRRALQESQANFCLAFPALSTRKRWHPQFLHSAPRVFS
jgi:hypothetical protein